MTDWLADFGDQNQVLVQLELSGQPEKLPKAYELPLFRIIQEGLNNIRQHARANSVKVYFETTEAGNVLLSLHDNGCAFDPGMLDRTDTLRHFGLRQMRERIQNLGGTFDIHSEISQGTELFITLPALNRASNEFPKGTLVHAPD